MCGRRVEYRGKEGGLSTRLFVFLEVGLRGGKRNKEEIRRSLSELKGAVNLYSKLKDLLPSVCKLFVSK